MTVFSFLFDQQDVHTNRDRCGELIDKVESYARVVFEALQSIGTRPLDDLEADLKHFARSVPRQCGA